MKNILLLKFCFLLVLPMAQANIHSVNIPFVTHHSLDSLPNVLAGQQSDLLGTSLKNQAMIKFATHLLPDNLEEWSEKREEIRNKIILHSGLKTYSNLPLDMKETGSKTMDGYTVKNIYFQTLPGVYATANLYIPEGQGPFPAVVSMHGHWSEGKIAESVQSLGHSMAKNGYVSLVIDAFGAGERTTIHGDFEYHGANLGASLMNIGESLLGVQVADNMRAVDLLVSLPYVDSENIGATGASGGGNQTMWFAALDERVKATMPIVSVGTFESAVMGSNCVCELLPGGLSFTESAGVLALYAPRALKMCNHAQDSNPTFFPAEMRRTFYNVKPVFKLHGVEEKVAYEVFDLTHGYWKEDREAMLGWFDLHLKGVGTGESRPEKPFELLPLEDLLVFPIGERSPLVISTDTYTRNQGQKLKEEFLKKQSLNPEQLKSDLRTVLGIDTSLEITNTFNFSRKDGWERSAIQTSDGMLIPILHVAPKNPNLGYTLFAYANGKNEIPLNHLEELKDRGEGIVVVELSGTGEAASKVDAAGTSLSQFHTLSRAQLWLGKTLLGEWVRELELVSRYIQQAYNPTSLKFEGNKEAGLAALFLSALEEDVLQKLTLRNVPVSYLFDNREQIDYFSMGIHLPGILNWGDVSLAAGLSTRDVTFIDPVSMSGVPVSTNGLNAVKAEFEKVKKIVNKPGNSYFQQTGSNSN
ncbi:dienelactone hydrolase family protein [Lunatibacter salilacus]|uniref:dienelactone hydrolase family protein n=1 Tax=Lunatibacter salilacus TaxID=2483804 RepID=UPI00131C7CA5|nr:acetylxylan esterase [Lunatibacter salilacus]